MKITAPIVLVLLLLAPVTSGAPDENLIVPGQRIGRWTLTTTVAALETMNGRAGRYQFRAGTPVDVRSAYTLFEWKRLGLGALTFDGKTIGLLTVSSIPYDTGKGVGVGAPLSSVLAAYGRPTARTLIGDDLAGFVRVIYDDIGLTLRVNSVTETVTQLGVFRPGAASSIWLFQAH